jgi:hypothetical protein
VQNYAFLFKHRLFRFLLGVFYEANAVVSAGYCKEGCGKNGIALDWVKKIR